MMFPARRESPHKVYVKVRADHMLTGEIKPLLFKEADGRTVRIDRIVDVREAPALKAGGQGIRASAFTIKGAEGGEEGSMDEKRNG